MSIKRVCREKSSKMTHAIIMTDGNTERIIAHVPSKGMGESFKRSISKDVESQLMVLPIQDELELE